MLTMLTVFLLLPETSEEGSMFRSFCFGIITISGYDATRIHPSSVLKEENSSHCGPEAFVQNSIMVRRAGSASVPQEQVGLKALHKSPLAIEDYSVHHGI